MGLLRFSIHPPERLTEALASRAYLSGLDRISWQVRASVEEGLLVLQRTASDSANLQLPWPVEGRGPVTLATGSLIERDEPYRLPLELARGAVCQFRNQLADWQAIGLAVTPAIHDHAARACELLGRAAVTQSDAAASAAAAEEAIRAALEGGDLLTAAYVDQAVHTRRRTGRGAPVLGADLGGALLDEVVSRQFLAAFNAAVVPFPWRDIQAVEGPFQWTVPDAQLEWCRACGLKVCGGPLALLDPAGLPDWLYLWEGDLENIAAFAGEFVRQTVERCRGKVHAWLCAGRVNTGAVLGLSEEDRLRLTAHLIELVHSLDPTTPVLASFDQPWAECLARRPMDVPPLHYVDALVRAELNLAGVVLEMNVGYEPGGTLPRTIFEFSRHLDVWSSFGLPLWISVSAPGGSGPDPRAARSNALPDDCWTPKAQQAWAARYVPLMLAKPYVQGVFWNTLLDAGPHDFPHAGLFDAAGLPKPALKTLAAARQAFAK
jgi:hypothetical protein